MAYIVFVQPVVLGAAGMDAGAVFTSTCLTTAFATILMALLANYPVAVAPAMGHNFFFAYMVVLTMKVPWSIALGAVFISGIVFVATASFGLRETIIAAVPESLKAAIAVGIGLLITLIGMEWAGLVRLEPNTFVGFILYAVLKVVTGRARSVHWLIYVFALLFVIRYLISGLH
jgi:adenine/guanine/hypoxanthine permease